MEVRNEECRVQFISFCYLDRFGETYYDICKKKYTTTINGVCSSESERQHLGSDSHEKNEERFDFYST